MRKHTPGPWRIEKCQCGHEACQSYLVSAIGADGRCSLEDARLISASPDLLNACEFGKDALAQIEGPELLIRTAEYLEAQHVNYLASLLRQKSALENEAILKARKGVVREK